MIVSTTSQTTPTNGVTSEHAEDKSSRKPTPRQPGTSVYECEPLELEDFRTAPQRIVFERTLDAPASRVFEMFEDAASWPVFGRPGIQEVEWTTLKPFGVGTERTVFFLGGMEVYERFVAWEPGAEMAFTFIGATQRVWWRFGEHYELTDLGSRCRWRWTIAYEPRHVFRRIHPVAGPMMKLALGRIAEQLVSYVRAQR